MKFSRIDEGISLAKTARKGSPTFCAVSRRMLPTADEIQTVKKIANCRANGLADDTILRIPLNYFKKNGTRDPGEIISRFSSKRYNLLESIADIVRIPKGVAVSAIQLLHEKFPKNGTIKYLNRMPFVQKHVKMTEVKNNIGTLQGIYKNGVEFLRKTKIDSEVCEQGVKRRVCESVSNKFDKLLNDSMGWGKPKYDTKYERFWVRIVSGFTAANFLGKDFFNKAKLNNKNDAQANQSAKEKVNQEVFASAGEAVSQFAFLATFAHLANTKTWVAPLFSALIGLTFNVASRVLLGRKLTRVKVPQTVAQFQNIPKIEDFIQRAKNPENSDITEAPTQKKKHWLSWKNVLLAVGATIAGGFALKSGMKTKTFKNLKDNFCATPLGTGLKNLKSSMYKDITTDRKELKELSDFLNAMGEDSLGEKISEAIPNLKKGSGIYLGRHSRTVKLFNKVEVPIAKMWEVAFAPFRFVKEFLSYPYKMVNTAVQASAKSTLKKHGINWRKSKAKNINNRFLRLCRNLVDVPERTKKPEVPDIDNIMVQFRKFKETGTNARSEFEKYVRKMRKISVNSITSSKISNEKLAVPAQILGMLSGIVFNMNDDFNQTISLGGSKEQAEKDARLRGVNKFIRVAVQATIVGTLNGLFAKYYHSSLTKAALITAGATITTDAACRSLTGMPLKKMSKEELDKHEKSKEKGIAQKYYQFVNRIVS